jgi:hypothetical protein
MLLQARNVESSENIVGQDILKILYASEEEKVNVTSEGKLSIVSPNGGVMESTGVATPQQQDAMAEQVMAGDEMME